MNCELLLLAEVPRFDVADVVSVDEAFASALALNFQPAQQLPKGSVFFGGQVFLGWSGDCLAVDARLDDRELWTVAQHRNEPLFLLGDTFELFAGVQGERTYVEYHYAPNGLTSQLRWPDNARKLGVGDTTGLEKYFVTDDKTHFAVHRTSSGWRVCVLMPASALGLSVEELRGLVWEISFGRYDYTKGGGAVVLSSTKAFSRLDFHLREEWSRCRFI